MSEGCLNEGVYLFFNHPEFPTGVKSKLALNTVADFPTKKTQGIFYAKENGGTLTKGN